MPEGLAGRGGTGVLLAALLALAACDQPKPPDHLRIVGANPERGRALIQRYACGSCHVIEGVRGAEGVVGPPLTNYAQRVLLAGIVPNAPRTLVPWLVDPTAVDPATGMPNLGITEPEARDIAAYLYTLGAEGLKIWPPEPRPPIGFYERRHGERQPEADAARIERAMEALLDRATAGQDRSPR